MPEFDLKLLLASFAAWMVANPWTAATTLVTVASTIVAGTPTPAPNTPLGRLYRAIEILALTVGRAKDRPPVVPKVASNWPRGRLSSIAMVLLLAGTLAACAVAAKPQTPAQAVYAIEADYHMAQRAALAYVTRPDADPGIERTVKRLEAAATASIDEARQAVLAGNDPRAPAAIAAAGHAVGALVQYLTEREILR